MHGERDVVDAVGGRVLAQWTHRRAADRCCSGSGVSDVG